MDKFNLHIYLPYKDVNVNAFFHPLFRLKTVELNELVMETATFLFELERRKEEIEQCSPLTKKSQ